MMIMKTILARGKMKLIWLISNVKCEVMFINNILSHNIQQFQYTV